MNTNLDFKHFVNLLLTEGSTITNKKWQGVTTNNSMREIFNVNLSLKIPSNINDMVNFCNPDLPWADNHFMERISGNPTNPGESYKDWKFYKKDEDFRPGGKFTHTYQERIWPKHAGNPIFPHVGIHYELGDLEDVINLMIGNPETRQAYLPIFFPEDTGAVHGGRIPCSLGYLFYFRDGVMSCNYYIRSCDLVRHFRNDIYLAMRLTKYVSDRTGLGTPGTLNMYIGSFHCFETDIYFLKSIK